MTTMAIGALAAGGVCGGCVAWLAVTSSGRMVERYLGRLKAALHEAGMQVHPALFLAACASLVVAAFLTGTVVLGRPVIGIIFGLLTGLVPPWILKRERDRRLERFEVQLTDALSMMASGLRAGLTIPQAMELIPENMSAPISDEFSLILQEHRLGVPLDEALENATKRLRTRFINIVISAVSISVRVGGDMARVFQQIADSIREIERLERNVKTATASGRMQAGIIAAAPLFMGFTLWLGVPDQVELLFTDSIGNVILLLVVVLDLVGFLMVRKITNVDV